MRWSANIGTFAGIGVRVHATFLILLVWVGLIHWRAEKRWTAVAEGIGFILALFGCVVLHEFGHALTARRFGIRTRDITLLPIGGVARLERMPDEPRQELLVAGAGPLVSLAIAGVLYLLSRISGELTPLEQLSATGGPFLQRLMFVNLLLVAFNLLPAFPMDGGRILRSLLALRMDYARATRIAATLGQTLAFGFGLLGLFGNPFLILIAFFVWLGATQEAALTQMKTALSGIPLSRAMITDFRTLAPDDALSDAVAALLAGSQQDFPVVKDGAVVGVLCRADLLTALARDGEAAPVGEVMRKDVEQVEATDLLEPALLRLQGRECNTLPVLQRGRLVGIVTMENVGEYISVQAAGQRGRETHKAHA